MIFKGLTEREKMISTAIQFAVRNKIQGDYVEFGVWKGDSLKMAWRQKINYGFKGDIYGYDSFEGLPHNEDEFKKGQFAETMENVQMRLVQHINLKKGWYKDQPEHTQPAAIVMIDVDLYDSAQEALRIITPALQDGTIIIFDDWYTHKGNPRRGEQRAMREWQDETGHSTSKYHNYGWHGTSYIIHKEQ